MSLPLVIVNPTSASGSTASSWPRLASELSSQFGGFKNVFTTKPGDATVLASEAAKKGTSLIIACGGDGTISEVANGILNSGKMLNLEFCRAELAETFGEHLRSPRNLAKPRASCALEEHDELTSAE